MSSKRVWGFFSGVVYAKIGSPPMTIVGVDKDDPNKRLCEFVTPDGRPARITFDTILLQREDPQKDGPVPTETLVEGLDANHLVAALDAIASRLKDINNDRSPTAE